jgi:hypothetical protein
LDRVLIIGHAGKEAPTGTFLPLNIEIINEHMDLGTPVYQSIPYQPTNQTNKVDGRICTSERQNVPRDIGTMKALKKRGGEPEDFQFLPRKKWEFGLNIAKVKQQSISRFFKASLGQGPDLKSIIYSIGVYQV